MKKVRFLILLLFTLVLLSCGTSRLQEQLREGEEYFNKGLYYKAATKYREAIRIDPKNALAHYRLGEIYYRQQEYSEAIGEFKRAAECNSNYAPTYYGLACSYLKKYKDSARAIRELRKAVFLDPNNASYHYALGYLYALPRYKGTGQPNYLLVEDYLKFDWAIKEFRRALRVEPTHIYSHYALGLLYYLKQMEEEAQRELEKLAKVEWERKPSLLQEFTNFLPLHRLLKDRWPPFLALGSAPPKVNIHLLLGLIHLEAKRYPQAIASFEKALKITPQDSSLLNYLSYAYLLEGEGLLKQNHGPDAQALFLKALNLAPPASAELRKLLGEIYLKNNLIAKAKAEFDKSNGHSPRLGDLYNEYGYQEEAAKEYEAYLSSARSEEELVIAAKFPYWPDYIHFQLVLIHRSQGRHEEARAEWEKISQSTTGGSPFYLSSRWDRDTEGEALLAFGNRFSQINLYKEALSLYKKALVLIPHNPEVHQAMGWSLFRLGRFSEALGSYRQALLLNPHSESPDFYYPLGYLYNRLEKKESLALELSRVLKLNPTNVKIHIIVGDLYRLLDMKAKAADVYEKALSLNPQEAELYRLVGDAYRGMERKKEAVQKYRKASNLKDRAILKYEKEEAIVLKPHDKDFFLSLGKAYFRMGLTKEAGIEYEKALALDLQDMGLLLQIIDSYLDLGMRKKAIAKLREIVELDPKDPYIWKQLGDAFRYLDLPAEAREKYEKAISLAKEDPLLCCQVGKAYYYLGKEGEALKMYGQALKLGSKGSLLYRELGRAYLEMGKIDQAIVIFNKALKLNPTDTENILALKEALEVKSKEKR